MITSWRLLPLIFSFALLLVAAPVGAQIAPIENDRCGELGILCLAGGGEAQGFMIVLTWIVNAILGAIGILAVLVFIYGGVLYLFSGGDEDKARKGRQVLLYGVIGLVIIGFSAAIVRLVIGLVQRS